MPRMFIYPFVKPLQGAFDRVDFIFQIDPHQYKVASLSPIRRFIQTGVGVERVYMCSFGNSFPGVVVLDDSKSPNIYVSGGLISSYGVKLHLPVTVTQSPGTGLKSKKLQEMCNATRDQKFAFGLSDVLALAQGVASGGFYTSAVMNCWNVIKDKLVAENMHPAKYPNAIRALYNFAIAMARRNTLESVLHTVRNMNIMKRFIFDETFQQSDEIELLTWLFFKVIGMAFKRNLFLEFSENLQMEVELISHMRNASMDFLKLFEKRDQLVFFPLQKRELYLWWTDFSQNNTGVSHRFNSRFVAIHIKVTKAVFLETMYNYMWNGTNVDLPDRFVNIMISFSERILHKAPSMSGLGTVEMHTQMKTSGKELQLRPDKNPIVVTYKQRRGNPRTVIMKMNVSEENGQVVDSSCLIIPIKPSRVYDMTVLLEVPGSYKKRVTSVATKTPVQLVNLPWEISEQMRFVKSFFVPRLTRDEDLKYPDSMHYILLRIENTSMPAILTGSQPSITVVKEEIIKLTLYGTSCFYLKDQKWTLDSKCQPVVTDDKHLVTCHCYVDAPYTANIVSASEQLRPFEIPSFKIKRPNLIPGFLVLVLVLLTSYYCYWAIFQDRRERDCAQIHAVKDFYKPESPEQYLVCIATSALPGSGTTMRVSFLLVGETGSCQTVMPEGHFCFSTGSEVWFLVSSDLPLGHIIGINVGYEKIVKGSRLNPWHLKQIIVYSKRFNHVIKFRANRTMGSHLQQLMLPSVPYKEEDFREIYLRFVDHMKVYHTLFSVFCHVPGKGSNKFHNAISSLLIILSCMNVALQAAGTPDSISLHPDWWEERSFAFEVVKLAFITCCTTLSVKSVYSLVFRKQLRVMWYHKPLPWKEDQESFLGRHFSQTWLASKGALETEEEVHTREFYRKLYFPSWNRRRSSQGTEDSENSRSTTASEKPQELDARSRLRNRRKSSMYSVTNTRPQGAGRSSENATPVFSRHTLKKDRAGSFSYQHQLSEGFTDQPREESGKAVTFMSKEDIRKFSVKGDRSSMKPTPPPDRNENREVYETYDEDQRQVCKPSSATSSLSRINFQSTSKSSFYNIDLGQDISPSAPSNQKPFASQPQKSQILSIKSRPSGSYKRMNQFSQRRHSVLHIMRAKVNDLPQSDQQFTSFRQSYFEYSHMLGLYSERYQSQDISTDINFWFLRNARGQEHFSERWNPSSLGAIDNLVPNSQRPHVKFESSEQSPCREMKTEQFGSSEGIFLSDENSFGMSTSFDTRNSGPSTARGEKVSQTGALKNNYHHFDKKKCHALSSTAGSAGSYLRIMKKVISMPFARLRKHLRHKHGHHRDHTNLNPICLDETDFQSVSVSSASSEQQAESPHAGRRDIDLCISGDGNDSSHSAGRQGIDLSSAVGSADRSCHVGLQDNDLDTTSESADRNCRSDRNLNADINSNANKNRSARGRDIDQSTLDSSDKAPSSGSADINLGASRLSAGTSIDKPNYQDGFIPIQGFNVLDAIADTLATNMGFQINAEEPPAEDKSDYGGSKNADFPQFSLFNCVCYIFKPFLLEMPVLLMTVCIIIFCGGWVLSKGLQHSYETSLNWLMMVMGALLMDLVLLEPAACLLCAMASSLCWGKPLLLNECNSRFKVVKEEINMRSWMVQLGWVPRHLTTFIHRQAAPQSASLFHLHHTVYRALKQLISIPVVFERGVYWLIIYTACIITLVNLQTDMYHAHSQNSFVKSALDLSEEPRAISVSQMWDYIEHRLRPGLLDMEANVNLTLELGEVDNATRSAIGPMLISPIRVKQIRLKPLERESCSRVPSARIGREQQCNFDFNIKNMENRSFKGSWRIPVKGSFNDRYSYLPVEGSVFESYNEVPLSGFKQILVIDEGLFQQSLSLIKDSDWIDQHTRYIIIDFSLLNLYSRIVSTVHITFDFKRPAPFWYMGSFHFYHSMTGNTFYYTGVVKVIFLLIWANNTLKELILLYKSGPKNYLGRFYSYVELTKCLLSITLIYVHFRKIDLKSLRLQELKYSYLEKEGAEFVDFLEMAILDYVYTNVGGILAFFCFFEILNMLSKIRRLVVFMRLVINAVRLFYMPLMSGIAFTFLSTMLFGSTNENFSAFGISYLMVNQYFIKPRAIYRQLTDNHPYVGPVFYFLMGMMISLFLLNFFVAFINEAYSSIHNKVRVASYKIRDKTKMEYVYEFLGMESRKMSDIEDDKQQQERQLEISYMTELKQLQST
ncbi:hypothetical protein EGW08_021366 [Elysia chlorotica]|uniref:PLAT domain-containing protein n=1 Tax=Elysia chlorotica TaxID=188477 RepID=A0A3S0ZMH9_ELYCH|nr:hypothetical protein EGW08_021366 [Elysia chlorotica]